MKQNIEQMKIYYNTMIQNNIRKHEAIARALTKEIETFLTMVEENNGHMPASQLAGEFDIGIGVLHTIMLGVYGCYMELE